jgi:GNAT superfamily N-acetyltransferase
VNTTHHTTDIPTFLPGRLWIDRGTPRDYRALERFHYRPKRPATWAGVWVVRYAESPWHGRPAREPAAQGARASTDASRVVAAAVLSWPTVHCAARDRALGIAHWTPRRKLTFVNRHVRTISRVVVHPQFRSLGLAARLVAAICRHCPTRHLEALAVMGRVHPFFEKGGMRKQPSPAATPDAPTYYHLDRARAPLPLPVPRERAGVRAGPRSSNTVYRANTIGGEKDGAKSRHPERSEGSGPERRRQPASPSGGRSFSRLKLHQDDRRAKHC